MPKGSFPYEYEQLVSPNKPLDAIWDDLQQYTGEYWFTQDLVHPDNSQLRGESVEAWVWLPPINHKGKFVKGILVSQAIDWLIQLAPELCELFIPIASSCFANYPWSEKAEAYLGMYAYPEREAWFREKYPEHAHKPILPFEKADWVHEYRFGPISQMPLTTEVICVSGFQGFKNSLLLAKALKIHRLKYPLEAFKMLWVTGYEFDLNLKGLPEYQHKIWIEIEKELQHLSDFLYFIPQADHKELPQLYCQSKCAILTSLIEGKNRSLYEAISCNTPAIHFNQLGQFLRPPETPYLPSGSAFTCDVDPEALADLIYVARRNFGDLKPRRGFLANSGRKNCFNRFLTHLSYYTENVPDWDPNQQPYENRWISDGFQYNYQSSLWDFLYDFRLDLSYAKGISPILSLLAMYKEIAAKPLPSSVSV